MIATLCFLNIWPMGAAHAKRLGLINWNYDKVYIFSGSQYTRFNKPADAADPGYPKSINPQTWPGLIWRDGVDAALNWGNGKAYFFRGNQYIRYDIQSDQADPGYPKNITPQTWPGLVWGSVDAAINWGNGKVYFFKGNQYIRYDIGTDRADQGYPKYISSKTWPGLVWNSVDGAVNWGNGKAYFIKGNQYIRYDIRSDRADPGYPKNITPENWRGVRW